MSRSQRPALKKAVAAKTVLQEILDNRGIKKKLEAYRAWQVWAKVVGPQIAARTQPVRIRDGILEVRVDNPVWMQQLQLMKPKILSSLNEALGGCEINDIYWRRGQLTPQQSAPEQKAARPPWETVRLSDEETAHIETTIATIEDTELRQYFRDLLNRQSKLEKLRKTQSETAPDKK